MDQTGGTGGPGSPHGALPPAGTPQPQIGAPPAAGVGAPGPAGGGTTPPADYKTIGIFMVISGVLSVLASIGLVFALIWVCVGVFWVVPLAGAIFEVVVAVAVLQGQPHKHVKNASMVGLGAAFLCGNVVGMVLEILALVNIGKPEVAQYLSTIR